MFKSFRGLDFGSTKPEYISGFGVVRDRTQLGVTYKRNGKACFVFLYIRYKVCSSLLGSGLYLVSPFPVSVGFFLFSS